MNLIDSSLGKLSFVIILLTFIFLTSITHAAAFEELTVFTNQKSYFLRDTVEIWGYIHNISENDNIQIVVVGPENFIAHQSETKIDREERDYEFKFTLFDNSLPKGIYQITVNYDEKNATTSFRLLSSQEDEKLDSTISLDKFSYSWTDTVEIFVNAPSYNRNNQVEYIGIGSELEGKIEIQTGMGTLENYRLIETRHDSGIFYGQITLTGDSSIDANGNNRQDDTSGILSNNFPFDGKIPARNNDFIKVTFSNLDQEFEKTSQIKWTIASIGWVKEEDSTSSLLRVIDKDMDFNPERKDFILIYDPSPYNEGTVRLTETGLSSGIFEGHVPTKNPVYFERTFPESKSSTDFIKMSPRTTFEEPKEFPKDEPAKFSTEYDSESKPPLGFGDFGDSVTKPVHVPWWVKKMMSWWGEGFISDENFIKSFEFLINEKIVVIEGLGESGREKTNEIPDWVKKYSIGWLEGLISDEAFVKAIRHLVEQGIIQVK